MTTFYVPVDLDRLPWILSRGWEATDESLYVSVNDALDAAVEHQAVIGMEFDRTDFIIRADYDPIEVELESLASRARRPTQEELEAGLFCDFDEGDPWAWDDPADLSACRTLKSYWESEMTWEQSAELFGSVKFSGTGVLAGQITLVSPVDVGQIQDKEERHRAAEQTEPVALTSLGASFWVWLLMMIQHLAFGKTPFEKEKTEASAAKKRARKAKRKKARSKSAKASEGASG